MLKTFTLILEYSLVCTKGKCFIFGMLSKTHLKKSLKHLSGRAEVIQKTFGAEWRRLALHSFRPCEIIQ